MEDDRPLPKGKDRFWSDQLGAIARELSHLAIACDIDITRPDISVRILENDASVCRKKNSAAFKKIRGHLMALYTLEERTIERLGASEAGAIIEQMWQEILTLRDEGGSGSRVVK